MTEKKDTYHSDCFITINTTYVLLDDGGDVRATAQDIESICAAKLKKGWGFIHECKYTFNSGLKIGKLVK